MFVCHRSVAIFIIHLSIVLSNESRKSGKLHTLRNITSVSHMPHRNTRSHTDWSLITSNNFFICHLTQRGPAYSSSHQFCIPVTVHRPSRWVQWCTGGLFRVQKLIYRSKDTEWCLQVMFLFRLLICFSLSLSPKPDKATTCLTKIKLQTRKEKYELKKKTMLWQFCRFP